MADSYVIATSEITLVDVTDQQGVSFFLEGNSSTVQTMVGGVYMPDYTKTPLVITPSIYLGLKKIIPSEIEVDEGEAKYDYSYLLSYTIIIGSKTYNIPGSTLPSGIVYNSEDGTITFNKNQTESVSINGALNNVKVRGAQLSSDIKASYSLTVLIDSSYTHKYQLSSSNDASKLVESKWSTTIQTPNATLPYLWARTDTQTEKGQPYIASYFVRDGVGIKDIVDEYYLVKADYLTSTIVQIIDSVTEISNDEKVGAIYEIINGAVKTLYLKKVGETSYTEIKDSEWKLTSNGWTIDDYLWTRSKVTYTDNSVTFTNPLCDTQLQDYAQIKNDLEVQLDTKIQTWNGSGRPSNDPLYKPWGGTSEDDAIHDGDLYIDTDTGLFYKYYNSKKSWEKINSNLEGLISEKSDIYYGAFTDADIKNKAKSGDVLITPGGLIYTLVVEVNNKVWKLKNNDEISNVNMFYGVSKKSDSHADEDMYIFKDSSNNNIIWLDTMPSVDKIKDPDYKYFWQRTTRVAKSGQENHVYTCLTNVTKSVSSIINYYYASTVNTLPDETVWKAWKWVENRPTLTQSKPYLWNYNVTKYIPEAYSDTYTEPSLIDVYREIPIKVEISSSTYFITLKDDGTLNSPEKFTLSATTEGIYGSGISYRWYANDVRITKADGTLITSNSFNINSPLVTTQYKCEVVQNNTVMASDIITVIAVKSDNSYYINLSNENTIVPTYSKTNKVSVETEVSTSIVLYKGVSEIKDFYVKVNGESKGKINKYSKVYNKDSAFSGKEEIVFSIYADSAYSVLVATRTMTVLAGASVAATYSETKLWNFYTANTAQIEALSNAYEVSKTKENSDGTANFKISYNKNDGSVGTSTLVWYPNSNIKGYDAENQLLYELDENVYINPSSSTYGLPQCIGRPIRNEIIDIVNFYRATNSGDEKPPIIDVPKGTVLSTENLELNDSAGNSKVWHKNPPATNSNLPYLWVCTVTSKYKYAYSNEIVYDIAGPVKSYRHSVDGKNAFTAIVESTNGQTILTPNDNQIVLQASLYNGAILETPKKYVWKVSPEAAYKYDGSGGIIPSSAAVLSKDQSKLTINEQDILNAVTFSCVMTASDGNTYQASIAITDKNDIFTINIESSSGLIFKNGNISTTLKCNVFNQTNGQTVNTTNNGNYKCFWSKIDENGNEILNWQNKSTSSTTIDGKKYYTEGFSVNVSNSNVNERATFNAVVIKKAKTMDNTEKWQIISVGQITLVDNTDIYSNLLFRPTSYQIKLDKDGKVASNQTVDLYIGLIDYGKTSGCLYYPKFSQDYSNATLTPHDANKTALGSNFIRNPARFAYDSFRVNSETFHINGSIRTSTTPTTVPLGQLYTADSTTKGMYTTDYIDLRKVKMTKVIIRDFLSPLSKENGGKHYYAKFVFYKSQYASTETNLVRYTHYDYFQINYAQYDLSNPDSGYKNSPIGVENSFKTYIDGGYYFLRIAIGSWGEKETVTFDSIAKNIVGIFNVYFEGSDSVYWKYANFLGRIGYLTFNKGDTFTSPQTYNMSLEPSDAHNFWTASCIVTGYRDGIDGVSSYKADLSNEFGSFGRDSLNEIITTVSESTTLTCYNGTEPTSFTLNSIGGVSAKAATSSLQYINTNGFKIGYKINSSNNKLLDFTITPISSKNSDGMAQSVKNGKIEFLITPNGMSVQLKCYFSFAVISAVKSLKSTSCKYRVTSSATLSSSQLIKEGTWDSTTDWKSNVSDVTLTDTNKYLWTATRYLYTDNTEQIFYGFTIKGDKGSTGSTGATGATGAAGVNSVNLNVDNTIITIPCDKEGKVIKGANYNITFGGYDGATRIAATAVADTANGFSTSKATINNTLTQIGATSGITCSDVVSATSSGNGYVRIATTTGGTIFTASSTISGVFTIKFSCKNITFTKTITLVKQIKGETPKLFKLMLSHNAVTRGINTNINSGKKDYVKSIVIQPDPSDSEFSFDFKIEQTYGDNRTFLRTPQEIKDAGINIGIELIGASGNIINGDGRATYIDADNVITQNGKEIIISKFKSYLTSIQNRSSAYIEASCFRFYLYKGKFANRYDASGNEFTLLDVETLPIVEDTEAILDFIADQHQLDYLTKEYGTTINNSLFFDDNDSSKTYIYFGNKNQYLNVQNHEQTSVARIDNTSFRIVTRNYQANTTPSNDLTLAQFNTNSFVLRDRYQIRFESGKGLYFTPLV